MKTTVFDNTIERLYKALRGFLQVNFDNDNLISIENLCVDFEDFPETLFQLLNQFVINNSKLNNSNKIKILEFVDYRDINGEGNDGLGISLNEDILLKKLKIYETEKLFDKIIKDINKYQLEDNILQKRLKEDYIILILRVYTKKHLFHQIGELKRKIENNFDLIEFNNNQKNRYYNYLARAYAFLYPDKNVAKSFLDKAKDVEITEEIEIRNYRYETLVLWKLENECCIEIARKGIAYIESLSKKDEYKKYYSDLNRLLGASLIKENINDALRYSQKAFEILQKIDYYFYEKFWIKFLMCSIQRNSRNYQLANELIEQLDEEIKIRPSLEEHPEARYKVERERLKILLDQKKNLRFTITRLQSGDYKKYTQSLDRNFDRYLMLAESFHYEGNTKESRDYIGSARVLNNENNRKYLKSKKYVEILNLTKI